MRCHWYARWGSALLWSVSAVSALSGQAVELAARGPRFLAVSPRTGKPVDASAAAVLQRRVSLDLMSVPVGTALTEIGRQAGLAFLYSDQLVPRERRASVDAKNLTVAAALTEVLIGMGLDVLVLPEGQLALARKREEGQPTAVGSIVGRVTDAKTRTALAGATVVVQGTAYSTTTGSDGRYRIADVAPGTYALRARYIGYTPGSASVTVSPEQEAAADFALEKSAQRLDEVVTTGTLIPTEVKALPTPITVITAEDIARQHPRRFDELLRLAVPGALVWEPAVSLGAEPTSMDISLRGASSLNSGASTPKIFVDGIEVADRTFLAIDPQSIDRVEIVRGPQASAIYGSDAMGGVIQIFTKRGGAGGQRPEIEAQAALGRVESSFPQSTALRQEYGAAVSGQTGAASYRVGGGYRQTGEWLPGYKETAPSLNGAARLEQGPLTVNLTARFEQVGNNDGFDPTLGGVAQHMNGQRRFTTYGLQLAYRPVPWWQHEATVGLDQMPFTQVQFQRRLSTPDDTLLSFFESHAQRLSAAYHTVVTARLASGLAATLTAGADHYTSTWNSSGTSGALTTLPLVLAPGQSAFAYRNRTTNTGLFGQAQLNLREALFLTGSVRADDNSDFGASTRWPRSTRVGATYVRDLGRTTMKLRAAYGEAIRAPFFGSKDSSDFRCGCYYQRANPTLRPERQIGPEGGVDLVFGRRGSLSVTYYSQTAKDFIYLAVDYTGVAAVQQFLNLARVKNSGWEFEGTLELGRATVHANFATPRSVPEDLGSIPENVELRVGQQLQGYPTSTGALMVTAALVRGTTVTAGVAYQSGWLGVDQQAFSACYLGTGPCAHGTDFSGYFGKYPSVAKLNLAMDQQLTGGVSGYLSVEDLTNQALKRAQANIGAALGRISTVGLRVRY